MRTYTLGLVCAIALAAVASVSSMHARQRDEARAELEKVNVELVTVKAQLVAEQRLSESRRQTAELMTDAMRTHKGRADVFFNALEACHKHVYSPVKLGRQPPLPVSNE